MDRRQLKLTSVRLSSTLRRLNGSRRSASPEAALHPGHPERISPSGSSAGPRLPYKVPVQKNSSVRPEPPPAPTAQEIYLHRRTFIQPGAATLISSGERQHRVFPAPAGWRAQKNRLTRHGLFRDEGLAACRRLRSTSAFAVIAEVSSPECSVEALRNAVAGLVEFSVTFHQFQDHVAHATDNEVPPQNMNFTRPDIIKSLIDNIWHVQHRSRSHANNIRQPQRAQP